MELYIQSVGIDVYWYDYGSKDQGHGAPKNGTKPGDTDHADARDVQSKFAIFQTTGKFLAGNNLPPKCTDHTINSKKGAEVKRQIPWPDIGCLAFIKIISVHDMQKDDLLLGIDYISGILDHSLACDDIAEMWRNPRMPLHPELHEYTLSLLRKKAPIPLIRSECTIWAKSKWGNLVGDNSHHFVLTSHDSTSLYCSFATECDISPRSAAEENLHCWFNSSAPHPPSPEFTAALLHYQPHTPPETERFELILSTPEMQAAAWKYSHNKLMLIDLTFNVCSAHVLLIIIMVVDENKHGIPAAFLMFTTRKEAAAIHSDYNTAILTKLLGIFKDKMPRNANGTTFEFPINFKVVMMDMDARECAALTSIWPGIFLLLCIFHIYQAWRNGLNQYLRAIPKGDVSKATRARLGKLLMCLMKEETEYSEAKRLYKAEIAYFKRIGRKMDALSKTQSTAALAFLGYLSDYMVEPKWHAYSLAGTIEAA